VLLFGISWRTAWELEKFFGDLMETPWELDGNRFKNNKPPPPPPPPPSPKKKQLGPLE